MTKMSRVWALSKAIMIDEKRIKREKLKMEYFALWSYYSKTEQYLYRLFEKEKRNTVLLTKENLEHIYRGAFFMSYFGKSILFSLNYVRYSWSLPIW